MPGRMERREEEEEARLPIRIVPTRRRLDEEQVAELRSALARLTQKIAGLREFSEQLRVRPDEATTDFVEEQADRLSESIQEANLTAAPVLGERYQNEVELISRTIDAARRAGGEGRLGHAINMLQEAHSQLQALNEVFDIEMRIMMAGMPDNIRLEGVEPDQAYDAVFEGLEASLLDIGTDNEPRSRLLLRLGRVFSENAMLYNIDDPLVRQERDALLSHIVERGEQARRGADYTTDQETRDREALAGFQSNIERIAGQFRDRNIEVFDRWIGNLGSQVEEQESEHMRERMQSLINQLQDARRRLREGELLSPTETRRLTSDYLLTTGREQPETDEEELEDLNRLAGSLRGRGRRLREGSPAWFGEQAILALNEGDQNRASLAISMGILERTARESGSSAREYIPDYAVMMDVLTRGRPTTPATLSRYSTEINVAFSILNIEEFEGLGGRRARARRERIRNAAGTARERLNSGNMEGARRLLNMISYYHDQLERNRWRAWEGSPIVEEAIDAEIQGEDATEAFNRGMLFTRVSSELEGAGDAVRRWRGRGISFQRQNARQMMEHIQSLAREGRTEEVVTALSLLAMYVESVNRLGERRRGNIVRISDENAVHLSGMDSQIQQMLAGEQADRRVFMQSYLTAQQTNLREEASRLEELANSRDAGQGLVMRALETARQRISENNLRGAAFLLQYIRDYYGRAGEGRREGWRYNLFSVTREVELPEEMPEVGPVVGYRTGRRMLERALEMEMQASTEEEHSAAARQFDRGTRRIAQTRILVEDYGHVFAAYQGTEQFTQGVDAGQLPLGERQEDGTFPRSIDMLTVRMYEHTHPQDAELWTGDRETDGQS
ncbi:hypothetical protein GF318_04475, partial [Candidatus Micrarchaeota archaeon]|nr:hypothetical protein [Candidatus Micrarchaeota archaeon]